MRGNRSVERAGVNALRTLLEGAGHIVQEIDGGNDHGEDLYVRFVEEGRLTSLVAGVQIKAGARYRRSIGYAIPVGAHAELWRTSNIPIIGVVYDPEMRMLYWRNVTKFLHENSRARSVPVDEDAVLTTKNVRIVCSEITRFIRSSSLEVDPNTVQGLRNALASHLAEAREKHRHEEIIGGVPNRIFASIGRWIEQHHPSIYSATILSSAALAVVSAVLTLTMVHEFAHRHVSIINPWLWTATVFGFGLLTLYCAYHEWVARRAGILLRLVAICPLALYSVLSRVELSPIAANVIAELGIAIAGKGMLILAVFYVSREIARRRRLQAAYGESP